jgi:malate dehydrogenase (quinone)
MPDTSTEPDITLVGAGIMSATLGVFLKELEPSLNVEMFETLEGAGLESSDSWNNAGTGHAANCELNYTPERADGSIDISKALQINVEFDLSRQLWSYVVKKGWIKDPWSFIHPVPHMSFVWGAENVSFLRKRFKAMGSHHCYHGMEYTEDKKQIADWTPLVMEGRTDDEPVAATRIVTGTDVDYGSLTNHFVDHLNTLPGFVVHYLSRVTNISREKDGRWRVEVEDTKSGNRRTVTTKFVFIGAGGGALPLLQKSGIPEGKGYGGFPVSGIWLRCDDPSINKRHHAKVYGKAPHGSPPMSVPHLDTRVISGQHSLLFRSVCRFLKQILKTWLAAGFIRVSQAALTEGLARSDIPQDRANIKPLLSAARDNFAQKRDERAVRRGNKFSSQLQ